MKVYILGILLLFCSFEVDAKWGVKGGLNYSTITGLRLSDYKFSGHIGATYDLKLSNKWYLQPELLFTSIGCNLEDDELILKDGHVKIYALEVPVNLSFRPVIVNDLKLLIDFGLYARYGLFGNKTYKYYEIAKVDNSPFDAYNRFDTGLNLGVGIIWNRYYGIFSFQRGFSSVEKGISSNHQIFKFSLGYKF